MMKKPNQTSITETFHFDLEDNPSTNISTSSEPLDFTIKVYLYGEESPTDTYHFQD